jgi:hypothetical protein
MLYDLNLSIVFTKLFYNTIQTLKHKNQPNSRNNGLHKAYETHEPCDGKKIYIAMGHWHFITSIAWPSNIKHKE